MVKYFFIVALGFLAAGIVQASCPDSVLNKSCTDDNVRDRRSCLDGLKRQLITCIQASEDTINGADKKVASATKTKRDAAVGGLSADLDQDVQNGRKIEEAFKSFHSTISDIKNEYADFTRRFFQEYKANENVSADKLEEISKRLNADTIHDLVEAQYQAIAIARDEQSMAFKNNATIQLLIFKSHYLENGLGKELSGLGGFLKERGLSDLEHPFDEILPSLDKMSAYVQKRRLRYEQLTSSLDQAFVGRLELVKENNVDVAIGESLKLAAALNASAQFMGEVEEARIPAFTTAPNSPVYGVPTYGQQYLALQKFFAYGSICDDQKSPSWTKSGCLRYTQYSDNAKRLYIGVGLSLYCIQNIPKLQTANPQIPNTLFDRMKALHAQKKFAEVIALYDSILKIERKP